MRATLILGVEAAAVALLLLCVWVVICEARPIIGAYLALKSLKPWRV